MKVVVIGSGPGGYVAAIRASQLGHEVTIVEATHIGGVCLNEGCIPSKALIEAGLFYQNTLSRNPYGVKVEGSTLDFKATQQWKDKRVVYKLTKGIEMLLQKNNVTILNGLATFRDDHTLVVNNESLEFDKCIIATGSVSIVPKQFELNDIVVDSKGALNFTEVPEHLVVVGGGYIGSELASAYLNLGSKVTIVEAQSDILVNFDTEMVDLVKRSFKQRKAKLLTNTQVTKIEGNTVHLSDDSTLEADKILISVGRRPNSASLNLENTSIKTDERGFIEVNEFGQTDNPNVYAIGDVTKGLALAHRASYEAKLVAENLDNNKYSLKKDNVVAIAFVDPECASVGLELKDITDDHTVSQFNYSANGRAMTLNTNQGFIRLISKDDHLVGAQIVGHNASELIGECALAIENNLSLTQIERTIHAHPTMNEMIVDAVEDALGYPIHQ